MHHHIICRPYKQDINLPRNEQIMGHVTAVLHNADGADFLKMDGFKESMCCCSIPSYVKQMKMESLLGSHHQAKYLFQSNVSSKGKYFLLTTYHI